VKRKPHVLLVAEDEEVAPGVILGCLEMGIVNVPRLFTNGMLAEIDQWGRPVCEVPVEKPEKPETAEGEDGKPGREDTNVDLPYIGNLAVAAGHRRAGLASRMVAEAEAIGAAWGYSAVCLHVDADSQAATALYARLGYQCAAREPAWYRKAGRVRRLFLRKEVGIDVAPVSVSDWEAADVAEVSRRLTFWEYLRYCVSDFGARRQRRGEEGTTKP
jgi:ribosomal protein S18 acetylase RimI-like enzyme